jgi:hypothetical protein
MGTWLNSDGLYIKYGVDEATVGKGGLVNTLDGRQMIEIEFNLSPLTTTGAIQDDNAIVPAGARIEAVEMVTVTAMTSGGSPTLDVGLIRTDRSTSYDDDGLIVASASTTHDAAGERTYFVPGGTGAGALIGTTLAYNGLIVASYNTAAYTAGKVKVRIFYFFP